MNILSYIMFVKAIILCMHLYYVAFNYNNFDNQQPPQNEIIWYIIIDSNNLEYTYNVSIH